MTSMLQIVFIVLYVSLIPWNLYSSELVLHENSGLSVVYDPEYQCSFKIPSGYKIKNHVDNSIGVNSPARTYLHTSSNNFHVFSAIKYPPAVVEKLRDSSTETIFAFGLARMKQAVPAVSVTKDRVENNFCIGKEFFADGKEKDVYIRTLFRLYWAPPYLYMISYGQVSPSKFDNRVSKRFYETARGFFSTLEVRTRCDYGPTEKEDTSLVHVLVSPNDIVQVSDYLQKKGISPKKMEKYVQDMLARGAKYLSEEEKRDYEEINRVAMDNLTEEEQKRMAYLSLRQHYNDNISDEDNEFTDRMFQRMYGQLPKYKLERLQYIHGKCLRTAMTLEEREEGQIQKR